MRSLRNWWYHSCLPRFWMCLSCQGFDVVPPFLGVSFSQTIHFVVIIRALRRFNSAMDSIPPVSQGHPKSIFRKYICSEDDLRSRMFGTFVVKFLACLPASPRIFEHLKNDAIIAHFKLIFTLKRSPRIFGAIFPAEIFEKVSFRRYNMPVSTVSTI